MGRERKQAPPTVRGSIPRSKRARGMNQVDFMINKNQLCAELEPPKTRTTDPALLRFKMAYFLLLPGSVRAYDPYLARLK